MIDTLVPLTPRPLARAGERGMTTAEYAVGVIAVIAAVGVLISIFMGGDFAAAVSELVLKIVGSITDAVK